MIANIDRQEIARLPIKQESNFTFKFSEDGWYIPVKKIWNKKEIDRVCFKVMDGDRENWFECSTKLAEKIQETVDTILQADDVDTSKVEFLDISIVRTGVDESKVFINVEKLPKSLQLRKWNKIWLSIKDIFRGKNGT